jgi:hypothetical protein
MLSNKHIQFLIEDSSYLLKSSDRLCLWEIVSRKEKELNLTKIMSGSVVKCNNDHLKVIRHVVNEI